MTKKPRHRQLGRKVTVIVETFFFLFAAAASVWLVVLIFNDMGRAIWAWMIFFVLLWGALAYLVLPRLHRLFTAIYVPNYFIGRSRTSSGLLGDPVNIAFNGSEEDLHRLMQGAGWTLADPVNLRSSLRIIGSTLSRRSYPEAPVSTLNLFERQQDFAYQQEVAGSPSKRHHIRFWRCPEDWPLPGGSRRVQWMGAASYDRAVGLSLFTLQVTHKIGSDIDAERDHVIETLKALDEDLQVDVLQDFSTAYHAVNGGGDEVITDGNLPIVTIEKLPDSVPEAKFDRMQSGPEVGSKEERDAEAELSKIPRPFSIYWALFLVFLQTVDAGLWFWEVFTHRDSLIEMLEPIGDNVLNDDPLNGGSVLIAAAVVVGVIAVVRVLCAWMMWAGYEGGRTWLMIFEGITVISSFAQWYTTHQEITLATTLIPVAISILLLLVLSSPLVGDYVRAMQDWRARRRASRARQNAFAGAGAVR